MCWLCMGIFVEHKLVCFDCFIFRTGISTTKKTEQEKQKLKIGSDQKRKEKKNTELKQAETDKISFLYKNDAFERRWRYMTRLFNI